MAQKQIKRLIDLIEETIQSPTVLIRAVGPHNQTDENLSKKSFETYKLILPTECYVAFCQDEFIIITFDKVEEAVEFCEDHFPFSDQDCSPEEYVKVWVYNENAEIVFSN